MIPNRAQLADSLRRLAPAVKSSSTLPALPDATPIAPQTGIGTESTPAATGGSSGLTLGDPSTVTLTSSDGIFTWQVTARPATLADGVTVVNIPCL